MDSLQIAINISSVHKYTLEVTLYGVALHFLLIGWMKTRRILHFMKIKIRPEVGISMCNYAAVRKWKGSVAWFLSCRVKNIADVECKFSRKHNLFMLLR